MRNDAVCMFVPASGQGEGISSFPFCPNLQTFLGRWAGNLYDIIICLMPSRESEYTKNNVTFPKREFFFKRNFISSF